ncbi:MAG: type II secretion system protein GspM [bacterium]|jgi:hypothetical protein
MNTQARNRRALIVLAVALVVWVVLKMTWRPDAAPAPEFDSIASAESRLAQLRRQASLVPGREQTLKLATAELESREKALIQSETAAQAQAQLLAAARRAAAALPQPIEFTSTELAREVTPLGDNYGEVMVSVSFVCQIENLVNFLAELTAQPEAIATRDMRIQQRQTKDQKAVAVRLTLSGLVPRKLVPQRRGAL